MKSDIRAKVYTSLGRVISGSVSDSYVQNAGLVFTKGTLVLQGAAYAPVGTPVSITYDLAESDGYSVPRALYVLSSSANAFTNQTTVSLGCRLTMLAEVVPKPEAGDLTILNPDIVRCQNGNPKSAFPQPMMAQDVAKYCCDQLALGFTFELFNPYMVREFDLTGGYLDLLGRLLLSESIVGYCAEGTELKTKSLTNLNEGGSTLYNANIISWEPVNSGQIAPDRAISPYIHKLLEKYDPEEVLWEEDEFTGTEEAVVIRSAIPQPDDDEGNPQPPIPVVREVIWTPYWKTITEYGEPVDLTDLCKPSTTPDLSNSVIKKVKEERQVLGVTATDYCAQLLSAEIEPAVDLQGTAITEEYYEYDDNGRPTQYQIITKLPFFSFAGKLQLDWLLPSSEEDIDFVNLGIEPTVVEEQIITYEYVDGGNRDVALDGIDEELKPGQTAIKTLTRVFKAFGLTQQGEQYSAGTVQTGAIATAEELTEFVTVDLTRLVEVVSEITFDRTNSKIKGQTRPSPEDTAKNYDTLDGQNRETRYAIIESNSAGGVFNRSVSYSPPFLPEAYLDTEGSPVEYDTQSVALRFLRAQSNIAVGARNGMSLTTLPTSIDDGPLAGVRVNAAGWEATGIANGQSWTFDANGMVQAADIVLIGGSKDGGSRRSASLREGETPECWLPLPSGYDVNNVPIAPDTVAFVHETIPAEGGLSLGIKAQSVLSNNLPPPGQKDVYIGLKLGLGGTAVGNVIQYAFAGVALGLTATTETGQTNAVYPGIKLGLNVESNLQLVPRNVYNGVALGVNIGPAVVPDTVLLHFDNALPWDDPDAPQTTAIDSSPNGHVFTTKGTGFGIYETDEVQPSRFGSGYGFFYFDPDDFDNNGGIYSSSADFALTSTVDWTVEGWIWYDSFFKPDETTVLEEQWVMTIVNSDGNKAAGIQIEYDGDYNPYLVAWVFDDSFSFLRPNTAAQVMLPMDTWIHFAFVQEGGTYTLYQNGIRADYVPLPSFAMRNDGLSLALGGDQYDATNGPVAKFATCLVDEFRIVNGKAIYSGANYQIPTGPFA